MPLTFEQVLEYFEDCLSEHPDDKKDPNAKLYLKAKQIRDSKGFWEESIKIAVDEFLNREAIPEESKIIEGLIKEINEKKYKSSLDLYKKLYDSNPKSDKAIFLAAANKISQHLFTQATKDKPFADLGTKIHISSAISQKMEIFILALRLQKLAPESAILTNLNRKSINQLQYIIKYLESPLNYFPAYSEELIKNIITWFNYKSVGKNEQEILKRVYEKLDPSLIPTNELNKSTLFADFLWHYQPKGETDPIIGLMKAELKNIPLKLRKIVNNGPESNNMSAISKNLILYGVPGTGKTYNTINYALAIIRKKNLTDIKKASDELEIDIEKQFNGEETDDFIKSLKEQYDKKHGEDKIPKSSKSEDKIREAIKLKFDDLMNEKKIIFTTFHQNYGYEDFMFGIRPKIIEEKDRKTEVKSKEDDNNNLTFEERPGIFYKICDDAKKELESKKDLASNYVLIIDEINRANISKVFGELITLLEDDKRIGAKHELNITLPNGEIFGVPPNVYVIGTMNTADKSIALVDVALRRRFEFIYFPPNLNLIQKLDKKELLKQINKLIYEKKHSADFLIGHSFFMDETIPISTIMEKKVIPLLMEYFSGKTGQVEGILQKLNTDEGKYYFDDTIYDWKKGQRQQKPTQNN